MRAGSILSLLPLVTRPAEARPSDPIGDTPAELLAWAEVQALVDHLEVTDQNISEAIFDRLDAAEQALIDYIHDNCPEGRPGSLFMHGARYAACGLLHRGQLLLAVDHSDKGMRDAFHLTVIEMGSTFLLDEEGGSDV